MKIASWNVNSIRVRAEQVMQWLKDNPDIDILCLQELKCQEESFPQEVFEHLPYNIAINGQAGRNGVAIFSKYPIENIVTNFPLDPDDTQARFLDIEIVIDKNALHITSLYVPNGENLMSEKFLYKIKFLSAFKDYIETKIKHNCNMIIAGDYNIAPSPIDVYDPLILHETIGFSSLEQQIFQDILDLGLTDTYRIKNINMSQEFTWWDYRTKAWPKNRGMRIDHILASDSLKQYLTNSYIDKLPRDNIRPSDHAPVIAEFKF